MSIHTKAVTSAVKLYAAGLDNEHDKAQFHRAAMTLLRHIAREGLGLAIGTFDLRSNKGGPGVLGEVTLHTDDLYIQVFGFPTTYGQVLYRTCKGRKDYTGGNNNYAQIDALDTPHEFVQTLRRIQ